MNNILTSQTAIGFYIVIAVALLYVFFHKKERRIWHEPNEIPKSEKGCNISKDIVIFDIKTQKYYKGYFDNERQRYYTFRHSLVLGRFRWRYLQLSDITELFGNIEQLINIKIKLNLQWRVIAVINRLFLTYKLN